MRVDELVKIAKTLERIQCRFLWEDEDRRRKFHLVKWEEVKKLVKMEGFGDPVLNRDE